MKVLLLTRYTRRGASSRLRSIQYLPFLATQGIDVYQHALLTDVYLERLYAGKTPPVVDVAYSYLQRLRILMQARKYDLVWLEKELFPYLPAFFEQLLRQWDVPYVVDYDDASFHMYDRHGSRVVRRMLGDKIDTVMRGASLVMAGNEYVAERAEGAGARRVEILPTAVDLTRYEPAWWRSQNGTTRIGWIGTPVTARYLTLVEPALRKLSHRFDIQLVTIGGKVEIPDVNVEHRTWAESTEAHDIRQCDVGIMPLQDDDWERGKSGYKLIQYMACAKPVVASPVGVNRKIVEHGETGFLAEKSDDWVETLSRLCLDTTLSTAMGKAGRERVEAGYSMNVTGPRLAELLRSAVE